MRALLIASAFALAAPAVRAEVPAASVVETETLDPKTSADLQAFKAKVAAANPGMDIVKVEADVVRRAVLVAPPPPPKKTPVMAIFVKNNVKSKSQDENLDDEVDGIRDRLAAEVSGHDFAVMDSAEIGAAFNRYKITTAEERAGQVAGLFTGGSVTRIAQMLGADYILTASINGASSVGRKVGDQDHSADGAGDVIVYTLRVSTKVMDATTGASVWGVNWKNKRPTSAGGDAMSHYNDLVDMWVEEVGENMDEVRGKWRPPMAYDGMLASFTVSTTLDDVFTPLAATVDASKPLKEEIRVVAGGVTVEVDGATVGSPGGVYRVRPGLHQMRVTRAWMKPWTGTVNITEGSHFNIALELSDEGFKHYRSKEALRAELAVSYAEAAFRRGCRVNFDTSGWQNVVIAPGANSTAAALSTATVNGNGTTQPVIQTPVVQTPIVQTPDAKK